VPEHRVPRGWEGTIADASIEPVAMHRQLLGQAKDRPLALELGLRPKLFRERDLATGASHLPDECPGNAGAARPTKPLRREPLGNLPVLVTNGVSLLQTI
jgi:hypothetical protein